MAHLPTFQQAENLSHIVTQAVNTPPIITSQPAQSRETDGKPPKGMYKLAEKQR